MNLANSVGWGLMMAGGLYLKGRRAQSGTPTPDRHGDGAGKGWERHRAFDASPILTSPKWLD